MAEIRALIVDDEPLARERIRDLLQADPEIEIVGECSNGEEALQALSEKTPDLLFLDVQMPDLDGFGVIEAADPISLPVIIFVTAFDEYAVKAFEVHALDYILKPFDRDRFQAALERAKRYLVTDGRDLDERLVALLEELQDKRKHLTRIVVRSGGRIFFVRAEDIDWIEAAGNYVELHVARDSHLLRETMNTLESRLDPKCFLRIHRRVIVNLERIKQFEGVSHGEYMVVLRDGTRLSSSRGYREGLQKLLGDHG
jgi:two-component system LytT family response regulator